MCAKGTIPDVDYQTRRPCVNSRIFRTRNIIYDCRFAHQPPADARARELSQPLATCDACTPRTRPVRQLPSALDHPTPGLYVVPGAPSPPSQYPWLACSVPLTRRITGDRAESLPGEEERDIGSATSACGGVVKRRPLGAPRAATVGIALAAFLAGSSVSAVASASVARRPSAQLLLNTARAWGLNKDGELGNGSTESSNVPVDVDGLPGVMAVAGGSHHSLALLSDGTVMAWGENFYGQLGDRTHEGSRVPVTVTGLREVAAVAAGEYHSLALLKDGTIMAWGRDDSGQLGDGGTVGSDVPVAVRKLSKVAAISAGASFSLALLQDGTVMAWGENVHGQLGDGRSEGSDIPVAVSGLTAVREVSAGFRHGLALLWNGTLMAWGGNEYGQLGDGTETQRDTPVAVSDLSGVGAIAAGTSQSLAVVTGGAVDAWGDNEEGQLGDGNHTGPERCGAPAVFACSKTPVPVSGLREVTAVSAGGHDLALLADGEVAAWGPNNVGQLGDGSPIGPEACGPSANACSTIPVRAATRDVASAISAGAEFSLALGPGPPGPLPELGRCVNVASGGAYRGARCTTMSGTRKGRFEWLPGPGARAKFNEHLGEPRLETVGQSKLSCLSGVAEGEYTGAKAARISHLRLHGCFDVARNASCQTSPAEEGTAENVLPLEGYLGFVTSGAKPTVGWEVRPRPPAKSLLSFECGSGASVTALALEGSVIGHVAPVDKMGSTFAVLYKQTDGRQVPESFEGEIRNVLTLTATPLMRESFAEQVGLRSRGMRSGEEPLEIKAKP
jgi:alpha-tubulin suppressor-like RCC1 family protein